MIELLLGSVCFGIGVWLCIVMALLVDRAKKADLNDDCPCEQCKRIDEMVKANKW